MNRSALAILLAGWLLASAGTTAWADGGTVRLSRREGGYVITVFTSPEPLRAGPVDVSVLVQEAVSGELVSDARVRLRLQGPGHEFECLADAATATNKLYQSAKFELPAAGTWNVNVEVAGPQGQTRVAFVMVAAEPLPRWLDLWPWLSLPIYPVLLFGLCEWCRRRRAIKGEHRLN